MLTANEIARLVAATERIATALENLNKTLTKIEETNKETN